MINNVVVQIPCLNEESTIGDVVRGFKKKLPKAKVIVYDNNSTDNSVKLAKKMVQKFFLSAKKVRVMLYEECLKKT